MRQKCVLVCQSSNQRKFCFLQVNLVPGEKPSDPYTTVCNRVIEQVLKDCEDPNDEVSLFVCLCLVYNHCCVTKSSFRPDDSSGPEIILRQHVCHGHTIDNLYNIDDTFLWIRFVCKPKKKSTRGLSSFCWNLRSVVGMLVCISSGKVSTLFFYS